MELHGPYVVQMAFKGVQAFFLFEVPELHLVVVTARGEQRLGPVELDASDWAFVLLEGIDQGLHVVVPELDHAVVQGGQDPVSCRVETYSFDPVAVCLKLYQHIYR